MNRRSLFGRFALPLSGDRPANRLEKRRFHMEPLEVRQVLATMYVDDNWLSQTPGAGTLTQGDTVVSTTGGITASYGDNAFGLVTNATSTTGNGYLTVAGQGLSTRYIDDAIGTANNGDTVSLLEGIFTESDIVIDKGVTFRGVGNNGGSPGVGESLIVPEVVSARAELEFPTGAHQGIIIYAPSVTVTNLRINGSGNGALGGSQNFHQGITTLYDTQDGVNGVGGTDYVPVRGPNMPVITTGYGTDDGSQHRLVPHLLINNVKVDNVWYKGITLSAPAGWNFGRTGSADENQVQNSVVNTVGDAGNLTTNHVGILIQNLDDANNQLGNAFGNTVSNVFGIGIASNAYGARSWNSRAAARNDTSMSFNTVNNASLEGFRNEFLSGGDFISNVANFSGGNTAIGLHAIRADVTNATFTSNGAKIGMKIEDSATGVNNAAPILAINFNLTGPGTGVAGSVGILADNSLGVNTDTTFLMAQGMNVSGFATGVKAVQSLSSVVPTSIFIDRPNVSGNAVGYDFGAGVTVIGQFNTTDPVTNAGASLVPQFLPNLIEQYADQITAQPTPPYTTSSNVTPPTPTVSVATSAKPDTIRTGNLTLGSGSTFAPNLNATPGSQTLILEDFTTAYSYTNLVSEDQINPWRIGFASPARLGTWAIGNVTQNGDGTVTVAGGASQLGAVFDLGLPADAQDVTTYQKLQIVVAKGPSGMTAKQFAIGIADQDGTTDVFFFPTAPLNAAGTGVYLTLNVNILAPPVRFQSGDGIMNLSHITGWSASGDLGSTDYDPLKTISIKLDRIEVVKGPKASTADVTGTVNLTGSSLAPTLGAQFASSVGGQYTIINNDGVEAITGTFTGLPEGAKVNAFSPSANVWKKFSISYVGGTNSNDVVLTEVANSTPVVDLNGGTAGTGYTSTWTNAGAVNITDAAAATVTDADDPLEKLTSMTASLTVMHTGDVLSFTPVGNITGSFNNISGVLTLSGTDTVANYQTALRSIKYDNTAGNPFANPVLVNIATTDQIGATSANALATINISIPGGSSSVVGRKIFYNQSSFDGNSAAQGTSDDLAIATDKTAYIPNNTLAVFNNITSFQRGINGIMVDLSTTGGSHAAINASDFVFKAGNNNSPNLWGTVTATATVSVRMGVSGADRVTITWASGSIANKWLEVQVLPTANTGLTATDVFFWGNKVGDTGQATPAGTFLTSGVDKSSVLGSLGPAGGITKIQDFNRDNTISGVDASIAIGSLGNIVRIQILAAGPFAPEGDGGDSGVASALAATSTSASSAALPAGVARRLANVDLNSGRIADFFQHLADQNTPGTRKLLVKIDAVADELGLDHDLLDSLLSDLGLE